MDKKAPGTNNFSNKNEEILIDSKTLFKKDEEGNLLPEGHIDNLKSPWKEVVEKIKDSYLEKFGNQIISIYASGSVARGVPDEQLSDIDTFAIVKEKVSEEEIEKFKQEIRKELAGQYDFSSGLDIRVLPLSDFTGDDANFRKQFIAKLLSTPIYGEDLSGKLPDFKANRETAIGLVQNLNGDLDKLKKLILESETPERTKKLCRNTFKRIIKNSFYPIMAEDELYTNSLDTMAVLFGKKFPEKADLMKEAFGLSSHPIEDKQKIIKIIDELGFWVADKNKQL
jgi:predicted nucleotidyltransferase